MSYSNKKWYKDLKASNPSCIYCGETLNDKTFTVDHIIPQREGGKDSPENCKPCCKVCNGLKGHMSYDDFTKMYPKEKILRIKKESNKNKELDGIEFMEEVYSIVGGINESMQSLLEKREYLLQFRDESQSVVDSINKEITFSEKTSASEGYKLFRKLREANRQLESCNNEMKFIDGYMKQINSVMASIESINTSMEYKIDHVKHSKLDRSLLEDTKTVKKVNAKAEKSVKAEGTNKPEKNHKAYLFAKSKAGIKTQQMHLKEVWHNVDRNDDARVFICSDRK